jgi:hypothetical protein
MHIYGNLHHSQVSPPQPCIAGNSVINKIIAGVLVASDGIAGIFLNIND